MLIGLVLVVAASNIVQFRSIDNATMARYRALDRSATSDVVSIGLGSPSLAQTYLFYVTLADVAPGSRLFLEESDHLSLVAFGDLALSFGAAESVQAIEPDARKLALDSATGVVAVAASDVGTFGSATDIEWSIVTQECDGQLESNGSRTFVIAFDPDGRGDQLSATEVCALPDGSSPE